MTEPTSNLRNVAAAPQLAIVGECDLRLWGMTPAERHARAFRRATGGVTGGAGRRAGTEGPLVCIRADYVLGEDLIRALVARPGAILAVAGSGERVAVAAHAPADTMTAVRELVRQGRLPADAAVPPGMQVLTPAALGSAYDAGLRKRADPLVLALGATPLADIERTMFEAVYKGVTDFVTKWCWPRPALWVTRWAAARGVTPNSVTTLSLVLVVVAAMLFAGGHWLAGLVIAWGMTFLDTVDGKLARLTLTSSRWGNLYDHGIDLLHPPFWWWAWWHGARAEAPPSLWPEIDVALWVVIGGYVAGRLLEGVFLRGFTIQIHVWRPIDSAFRTVTARRNPNLAILTMASLFGRPDLGFLAVAVWTIVCLTFHAVRLGQAMVAATAGAEIRSWMSEPN
jgi:phosphatidylglycerophosphate synthase